MVDNQIKLAAEESDIAQRNACILCVDDEVFNLEIMEKHLHKANYKTICATDGQKAWEILKFSDERIDVVLLDRMMPEMDGITLLKHMKADPELKNIPVILQTAKGGSDEAVEGIEAGAYYYVTKPYAAKMLLSVIEAALREFSEQQILHNQINKRNAVVANMQSATFHFKGLDDARELAGYIASMTADPSRYIVGLTALLINAIEHGNLGIGGEAKYDLLVNGEWEKEIAKRLQLKENEYKKVVVSIERNKHKLLVIIKDQGAGFNWRNHLEFDPTRMTEPCGRGIAMAGTTNPGNLKFIGNGNEVHYLLPLPQQEV